MPQKSRAPKIVFIAALALNLLVLFYFKYFNFFTDFIGAVTASEINVAKIALPIGISFFTFQAMSYTIDVYTGKSEARKNIFDFALYISLFPQLIAGPIIKYGDINEQLTGRVTSPQKTWRGIRRFSYGLAKKCLFANVFGECADKIFAADAAGGLGASVAWFGVIFYALQIYYDFSGYSDMALGLGKMFGFEFLENFDYPYTSKSIREFWRRWHISLSSWFREYVYIPLGGNRKGKARTYLNLLLVFLLTGLWHGANYTFIVWGLFFGTFLVIERAFLGKLLDRNPEKTFNRLYVALVVLVAWVFFRADNLPHAFSYLGQMFSFGGGQKNLFEYVTAGALVLCLPALLAAGFLQKPLGGRVAVLRATRAGFIVESVCVLALLAFCILMLANNTYNPFIYFQF